MVGILELRIYVMKQARCVDTIIIILPGKMWARKRECLQLREAFLLGTEYRPENRIMRTNSPPVTVRRSANT